MEEIIYKILTDESARSTEVVAQNLTTETVKSAPWCSFSVLTDPTNS